MRLSSSNRLQIARQLLLGAWLILCLPTAVQATSSETYYKEAQAFAEKGDVNAAIIQLKNALKEDPKNIKARFFLGQTYLKRGDGANAEKELERARSLGMEPQQLVVPLGQAYLLQGKAEKVLAEIRNDETYPNEINAHIHVLRANAHMGLDDEEQASAAFASALKLEPNSHDALLGQARIAIVRQQFDTAQELVAGVLKDRPTSSEGWTVKGEIARLKGDLQAAKQGFDKAIELESGNFTALLGSASVSLALGDMATAKNRIAAIRRPFPNHPIANYLHAVILFQEQNLAGAQEALQGVLREMPDHAPSLQLMGTIDYVNGRYEQAQQALARVVTLHPKNIPAIKLLAATQLKLQQPAKAVKTLEPIMNTAPPDAQLLALMGTAYLQNKETEKGTEYLQQAVDMAPDAAGIHTQLALGRLASGETSQAVKELQTAVDLGQNVFQADVLLTMVHLRKKEYQKALEQAQRFGKKLPDNPLPYNLMGAASMGLNQPKIARQHFEQALKNDPKFIPALLNLGLLDESEGNTDAARERYLTIIKLQEGHLGATMSLARIAEAQGAEDQALKYFEAAWKSNSGAIQPGLVLVDYFNRKRQPLRAISIARELKTQHPENAAVLNALGASQMAAKDYHNAQNSFAALVKLLPQSEQAHYLLGQSHFALEDFAAARTQFQKAISLTKDFLPAQLALAGLEMKSDRSNEAMQIAQTIQKQRPTEMAGFRLEGDVLMNKGDFTKAADVYQRVYGKFSLPSLAIAVYEARKKARMAKPYQSLETWLHDHPDDVSLRIVLGGAYQDDGRHDAAMKQYELVLQAKPDDVVALNNMAWTSYKLGKTEAVRYAERAYALASDNPAVVDTLGWLLVESGEPGRGLTLLQQAVAKAPHISEVRYHLAVGLHKMGRNAEAKTELKRALDGGTDFTESGNARALLGKLEKI